MFGASSSGAIVIRGDIHRNATKTSQTPQATEPTSQNGLGGARQTRRLVMNYHSIVYGSVAHPACLSFFFNLFASVLLRGWALV